MINDVDGKTKHESRKIIIRGRLLVTTLQHEIHEPSNGEKPNTSKLSLKTLSLGVEESVPRFSPAFHPAKHRRTLQTGITRPIRFSSAPTTSITI